MNELKKPTSDYRNSHLHPGKGSSYDRQFTRNPYRSLVWEYERKILDRVMERWKERTPPRHLDFACGTGRILRYLENRTGESVGADLSPSMLEPARGTLQKSEIIEADLTKNDILGDRRFDLITAFRFFPNAQEELRSEVVHLLARHLAPEGWLIFNNHKNTRSLRNRLARALGRKGFQGMSPAQAKEFLNRAGLEVVDIYHFGVLPATEGRLLLPRPLLRGVERVLARWKWLRYYGQNLIYVCRHGETSSGA